MSTTRAMQVGVTCLHEVQLYGDWCRDLCGLPAAIRKDISPKQPGVKYLRLQLRLFLDKGGHALLMPLWG